MRIVHALNYSYNNHGQAFGNPDQKLQHGFIENGHYSYAFPCNDIARQSSWRNSKNGGADRMNASLIETCVKVQPDLLVLGHGQLVKVETIEAIKEKLPNVKVIQWFVDPMIYPHIYQFILDRLHLLDAVYLTTGGEYLDLFKTDSCQAHFFPNPVHQGIEKYKAFESESFDYDLIFIGNDGKDPARRALLEKLEATLSKKFKLGIFGSLGRPGIHGVERDLLFQRSKASLNLTRHDPMKWYSSDRVSQLLGNGLLTCTHAGAELHEVYGEESLIEYEDTDQLSAKLEAALSSGDWKKKAEHGWSFVHENHSAKAVTAQMLKNVF